MSEKKYKNKVELKGVVQKYVNFKEFDSGKCKCNFSIKTVANGMYESYHRCVAWDDKAKACKDFKEGDWAEVVGNLQTRKWTKGSGEEQTVTEVNCYKIGGTVNVDDSDIPF